MTSFVAQCWKDTLLDTLILAGVFLIALLEVSALASEIKSCPGT